MSFSHWSRAEVCGGGLTDGQNTDTHQGCDRACSVRKRLVGFFSIIFLMKSLAVDRQMVYIHIHIFNVFVSNILEHWLLHRVVLKTFCRSRRWMGGQRCCTAPPKSFFWNHLHKSSDRKPCKKPTCQSSTLLTNPLRSLRSFQRKLVNGILSSEHLSIRAIFDYLSQRCHPRRVNGRRTLLSWSWRKVASRSLQRREGSRRGCRTEDTKMKCRFRSKSMRSAMLLCSVFTGQKLTGCKWWRQWTSSPLLCCRVSGPEPLELHNHTLGKAVMIWL